MLSVPMLKSYYYEMIIKFCCRFDFTFISKIRCIKIFSKWFQILRLCEMNNKFKFSRIIFRIILTMVSFQKLYNCLNIVPYNLLYNISVPKIFKFRFCFHNNPKNNNLFVTMDTTWKSNTCFFFMTLVLYDEKQLTIQSILKLHGLSDIHFLK